MQDLASMFGSDDEESADVPTFDEPQAEPKRSYGGGGGGSYRPKETIEASANAYRDMNRTLGSFYETPKEDPEKEELKQRLEQMQEQMAQMQSSPQSTMDEQIALMEKSYELAAKYNQGQQQGLQPSVSTPVQKDSELIKNGKAQINNVGEVRERVVSGLSQPIDDSTFIAEYSKPRNLGFHTAVGNAGQTERNTIKACVHDNQTITDGQAVRLRLLEAMRAGTTVIPQNTLVTGIGKVGGKGSLSPLRHWSIKG